MSDVKISGLPASTTPLAGSEVLPVVQGGVTKKVSVDNLTAGKAVSVAGLTDSTLTASSLLATDANKSLLSVTSSATTPLGGTEELAVIQGGSAKKVSVANLTAGRSIAIAGATLGNDNLLRFRNAAGNITGGSEGAWIVKGTDNNLYVDNFEGDVIFRGASYAERAKVTSSGNLSLTNGNFVVGTSGKGIDFSANTGAAGATKEVLDWYEEGTWTPNQGAGLAVSGTFSSTGRYTRIGRQVTVMGSLQATTSVSCAAGAILLSNLPFTVQGEIPLGSITSNGGTVLSGVSGNPTTALMYAMEAQGATTALYFQMTYFV